MASKPDRADWSTWAVAAIASLLCWWLATRLHPFWWAAWLAPIPVLWLATRASVRRTATTAFLVGALASLSMWHYYHDLIRLPMTTIALATVAPGVVFMFAVLFYRRLSQKGRPIMAMLAVPVWWTALGFASAQLSPNGTWGDLAYSQMGAPLVIQVAALTGVWGVGFLVLLTATSVATVANREVPPSLRIRAAGLALAVLALTLGYGGWRLHSADSEPSQSVRVGMAALEATGIAPQLESVAGQQLLQRYVLAASQLAADGAQIIVLPEKLWSASQPTVPALAELAQRRNLTLVTGMAIQRDGRNYNMALAFSDRGDAPAEYTKHHLIPGLERAFTAGTDYTTLTWRKHVGLVICKDLDFPSMGRAYAKRGVRLLLVPAWDFGVDGWLHSRMAILRGVESGFAIARAASDGTLTLSDNRGRVVAEAHSAGGADAMLMGTLPVQRDQTLYALWGNWFAWLDLAGLIALLYMVLRPVRP